LSAWLLLVAAAAMAAVALPTSAAAKKPPKKSAKAKVVGRVYTETNNPSNNQVLVFDRLSNGTLRQVQAADTGGSGGQQPQPGCVPTCPSLDTQGELALTPDGHLLFAVNAGSDSITSFRATHSGLKRVSVVSSDGPFPNSLTIHGNLLYVLDSGSNAGPPNIAGFRFSRNGKLKAIAGSVQPLVGGALPGAPRQVGFDNSGKVLMVTLLANVSGPPPVGGTSNTIDTFRVSKRGVAGPGAANNSTSPFPFGFAFDPRNHAIVSQVKQLTGPPGDTASYKVSHSGAITPIDTKSSNGNAPCWVVITTNGRYAYVVNTGGGAPGGATVAEYKLARSGKLTSLGNTAPSSSEFALTDEALSKDNKFLYVLSPLESGSSSMPGPNSHIDVFAVHHNGSLTLVSTSATVPAPGLSGLVAH
jgi:6-phosphogluconolactonase (cycloisomerase 2 family)